MIRKSIQPAGARVLVLGLTFKENCPDIRNSKVVDVISELESYRCQVDVCDPWVQPVDAEREYDIQLVADPEHVIVRNRPRDQLLELEFASEQIVPELW